MARIINPMTSTIFWSVISFLILFFVMWRFVFKPVNKMVDKRNSEIRDNINEAEKQKDEAMIKLEQQKTLLEDAKKQAEQILENSREAAKKIKEEIEESAHEKSRKLMEDTIAEINREKEKSLEEVRDRIVDIALKATEKIISEKLSEEDHKRIIEENIKEIGKTVER